MNESMTTLLSIISDILNFQHVHRFDQRLLETSHFIINFRQFLSEKHAVYQPLNPQYGRMIPIRHHLVHFPFLNRSHQHMRYIWSIATDPKSFIHTDNSSQQTRKFFLNSVTININYNLFTSSALLTEQSYILVVQ